MTLDFESVGGELVGASRGRVLRFQAGRICQEPGCRTRLSVYNSRSRCALHDFDNSLVSARPPAPPGNVHRLDAGRRRPAHRRATSAA